MTEFWDMGKYAYYVWSSYAIVGVVLAWNLIAPLRAHRRLRRALRPSSAP